ncbi:hypothetical protein SAMN02927921_02136 [Sinomicrobium oceani]|uniref:Uncharacterized protein n=1 Tax=Sinomicrobium oceani TaxID=1150368 RepID=A0A1K1PYH1_9FLAO|nr:hypothetical protein [Sinomicrobium oceani]SFW52532.1 hypothetical protein SAMN02927921_02136 [Sinomicrobium oceani]
MKIGKPFNQFTKQEYLETIPNHKQYSDFNTLGLYRSLLENEKLSLEEKLEIRDFANQYFQKTFEFLQLKDPQTYFEVSTLGEELTRGDELNHWRIIRENQEKVLKDKKIKHRNFGTYSKHDCGYDNCPYNGLMIKQGSHLAETSMCFSNDENKDKKKQKVQRREKEQREWKRQAKY